MTTVVSQSLQDKVALVTGAGSGIGRASALVFAAVGASVVVSDINADGGRETVERIGALGGEATCIRADVTQASEVSALVSKTVERYGRLDCACNVAGIAATGPFHDFPDETWHRVIAVNLTGVFLCMKQEIAQMLGQGGGSIVNLASIAGLVGGPDWAAYVASKHGVVGLTKTAALEYAQLGIRVNAVCPAFINTPMVVQPDTPPERVATIAGWHPVGRLGTPEEVAGLVLWLCTDASSFVTGAAYTVDGGYTAR